MNGKNRMSPVTALFIGLFGVGAVGIASAAAIVLYGMRIIDTKASTILGFAEHSAADLPGLIKSLPPAIDELLGDRCVPQYTANIDIAVNFVQDQRSKGLRPVMTITNNGSEVISMLVVRVVALNRSQVPIREWTEVVATPIGICDEWRGPLWPGKTRHVVMTSWRTVPLEQAVGLSSAVEISELRIWRPKNEA